MCTLSWIHHESHGGYQVFFNRDEQRYREPATPPEIDRSGPIPFVTARDTRAGGTWLLTNARGLTIAILNHYDSNSSASKITNAESRGLLVTSLASCESVDEFRHRLATLNPAGRYRPFLLIAISRNQEASLWCWDGEQCSEQPIPEPAFLTTSSFKSEEVIAHRTKLRQQVSQLEEIRRLHQFHDPTLPAHSIRMSRPDAVTVALCELRVGASRAYYRYQAESEHDPYKAEELCLRLVDQ